jgi:phosphoenolpyruvate carboxykinase (ATP)
VAVTFRPRLLPSQLLGAPRVADPDFGYEIAASLPGVDDAEILQPRRLYERQGRLAEYDAMVARLKRERREFLGSFPGLDEEIVKSIA